MRSLTLSKTAADRLDHLSFPRVALVLQGGGELGAYQGGAYQRLDEAGIQCDWIAGVSIGALNAVVIAGNPPGQRVGAPRALGDHLPAGFHAAGGDRRRCGD